MSAPRTECNVLRSNSHYQQQVANNSQYFDDQYNNLAVAELQIKSDSYPLSSSTFWTSAISRDNISKEEVTNQGIDAKCESRCAADQYTKPTGEEMNLIDNEYKSKTVAILSLTELVNSEDTVSNSTRIVNSETVVLNDQTAECKPIASESKASCFDADLSASEQRFY